MQSRNSREKKDQKAKAQSLRDPGDNHKRGMHPWIPKGDERVQGPKILTITWLKILQAW
jgi:hypothetical protein